MKSKNFKRTLQSQTQFFDELSKDWWDEDGPFKALHSFNLIRINFIKDKIIKKSFKGLKVLDIGCGGGLLCEPLSRLGADVTGIDNSEKAIKVAKNHAIKKKLKISYFNSELSILKDEKYDLITCMEVLEHVDDVEKIILLSKKLLKKNGLFLGSTINKSIISYLLAICMAENIVKIVPKGTHEWSKLLKPNYLKKIFLKNDFYNFCTKGVIYNPLNNEWRYSNQTYINYLFSAENS